MRSRTCVQHKPWCRVSAHQTLAGTVILGVPRGSAVRNLPAMQETWVPSLGQGRYPRGGNGNPFQYSCQENPTDRGAWRATVRGVPKSWTPLSACSLLSPLRAVFPECPAPPCSLGSPFQQTGRGAAAAANHAVWCLQGVNRCCLRALSQASYPEDRYFHWLPPAAVPGHCNTPRDGARVGRNRYRWSQSTDGKAVVHGHTGGQ